MTPSEPHSKRTALAPKRIRWVRLLLFALVWELCGCGVDVATTVDGWSFHAGVGVWLFVWVVVWLWALSRVWCGGARRR